MKISAIICEYNPFHTGHLYQINKIKSNIKDTAVLCLMSGNFVQRGDVAILDKYTRGKIAIENGADLVLELPCFFATQVANIFSRGAINLLNDLNVVDYLCFGSESGDINYLMEKSRKLLYDNMDIKQELKKGISFVKAYSKISDIPSTSNDILAIEYIKALLKSNSKIKACTFQRKGSRYNDTSLDKDYVSASAIRKYLQEGHKLEEIVKFLGKFSDKYLKKDYMKFDEDYFKYIKYAIITKKNEIKNIFEIGEGLENLIISNTKKSTNLNQLIMLTKSKRYTYTRIRRALFNILMDIKKSDIDYIKKENYKSEYVKILAFNDIGRKILKKIKLQSDITIVNKNANYNPKNEYAKLFWEKDITLGQIYNIEKKSYYFDEYITSPIYKKLH